VDLRAWARTLDEIEAIAPERFGATHFGLHGDVPGRAAQLRERLDALEARVRRALDEGDDTDAQAFDSEVRAELAPYMGEERVHLYFDMFSAAIDWRGVAFYVERNS
jgi:hypothetical protein